ncbi:MAG TPA: zinc ribbon domain-containing protein [Verrucomicrobiae bacterium]|nr:zinc ribbon domain-containing protein [Verrucomicrobiae bacterium]
MPVEALNCPMCGAPAGVNATRCDHCGARLATVGCPSCFGLIFAGSKFCPHCGARVERAEEANPGKKLCPGCRTPMQPVRVGSTDLLECPHCEGIWADAETLKQICSDREEQSAVLGMANSSPGPAQIDFDMKVRYVPCPICRQLMNRVNFAHCSNVIVDVCKAHGTWFEKDELRKIVEFIRGGGLEASRQQEMQDLERQRRALKEEQRSRETPLPFDADPGRYAKWEMAISAAARVLNTIIH